MNSTYNILTGYLQDTYRIPTGYLQIYNKYIRGKAFKPNYAIGLVRTKIKPRIWIRFCRENEIIQNSYEARNFSPAGAVNTTSRTER